jgi:hypothetical protein
MISVFASVVPEGDTSTIHSITSSARASSVGGTFKGKRPGRFEIDHQLELGVDPGKSARRPTG